MPGRTPRTPTPIMVTPLDLSEIEASALAWLRDRAAVDREHGQDVQMPTKVSVGHQPWGIVTTHHGLYALNHEGVGPEYPITDENRLAVDIYVDARENDGGEQFISMFPAATARLTPAEIEALPKGEPVNLADFVRVFGARLETNYETWRRTLEIASVTRV